MKPLRFTFYVLRRYETLSVTLFFTLLTLVMTWPWVLRMGEAINPFGDVIVQMTSLRWNAHALLTNPFGLFEAPFFYPYAHSLAFSENLLGQTIIALPILLITGNPALAANLNILLSFVLTGVFTYLLVRDLTGSRAAGILSGVAFAFCPFRFMQMGHLHMLATEWFPFTLWALRRGLGVRGQGSGVRGQESVEEYKPDTAFIGWAAFGFVAMGLSSVYYIYFLALAVLLYLVWWAVVETRGVRVDWGALLLKLGVAGLLAGLVLAPVFVPYLQSNRELGFSRSTYEVQNWAAHWSYFGNVLQANWLYGKILAPWMVSISGERELFPGIVPVILALLGLIWGRGRERFFYLLLGLLSLVLAFGLSAPVPFTSTEIPLPYAFLYDWIPGFKALRVPVRFAVLIDFSIYVLAGYGVARLVMFSVPQLKTQNSKLKIAPALLSALILLEFINPLDTSNHRDVTAQLQTTEPYVWLARPENSGIVLELPMTAGQDDVWYTFFETRYWQPLVNGWSSFVPPGTVRLKQTLAAFPDPTSVALLQGLEVRHVVVHLWQFPKEEQADLKSRLDQTPQLEMVNQSGDNYVYRVAPDAWLRKAVSQIGSDTLWVGEARHDSMPTLEVLAYALMRWGMPPERIGGNIAIGYRSIRALPFGTPADYALVPNAAGTSETPFGYEDMQVLWQNAAVRLLKRNLTLVKSFDLSLPGAPTIDPSNLRMGVSPSGITFDGPAQGSDHARRVLDLNFAAFSPSQVTIKVGDQSERLTIPSGVSHYLTSPFDAPQEVRLQNGTGDFKLLRADLRAGEAAERTQSAFLVRPNLMPAQVIPSKSDTLDTRLRVVSPRGGDDFTATVDVYVEPWGTHPDGHFGSWSVVLPADGAAHDYSFHLDPLGKQVNTTRDNQPVETFAWIGPPTQGDFRATLSISGKSGLFANIPLYTFTLDGDRLTDWQAEPASLSILYPQGK